MTSPRSRTSVKDALQILISQGRLIQLHLKLPRFHGHFVDKTEGVRNAREEQAVPRAI